MLAFGCHLSIISGIKEGHLTGGKAGSKLTAVMLEYGSISFQMYLTS